MKTLRLLAALTGVALWLSGPGARAEQLCDCHQMCAEASDPGAYPQNLRAARFLSLADAGWLYRSERDLVATDRVQDDQVVPFAALVRWLGEQGSRVAIVQLPPRTLVIPAGIDPGAAARAREQFRELQFYWQTTGAAVPDADAIRTLAGDDELYFRRDTRLRPAGARAVARAVSAAIAWRGDSPHVTERKGIAPWSNNLGRVAESLCQTRFPREYYREYVTRPVTQTATERPARVLLVTDENGDPRLNLAGFMAEQLAATVTVAMDPQQAISMHANTPREQRPDWVVFVFYSLNDWWRGGIDEQTLLNVAGKCDNPVLSGRSSGAGKSVDLIVNTRSLELNPAEHYLYVSAAGGQQIRGNLRLWYTSGYQKDLKVRPRGTSMALPLPVRGSGAEQGIVAVDFIQEAPEAPVQVDVCRRR